MARRIQRSAESPAVVAPEWVEPDVLDRQLALLVHIEFAAALGLADKYPVGGAVAGTSEAVGLHEGLQQHRAVAVASLSVVGQPAADTRQHCGSEIAHLHPRQDQEAGRSHGSCRRSTSLHRIRPEDQAMVPAAGGSHGCPANPAQISRSRPRSVSVVTPSLSRTQIGTSRSSPGCTCSIASRISLVRCCTLGNAVDNSTTIAILLSVRFCWYCMFWSVVTTTSYPSSSAFLISSPLSSWSHPFSADLYTE